MSTPSPRFSLPGWLLTCLFSTLGVLIVIYAVHIDRSLKESIMQGFDRKLLALSTTMAANFDSADHSTIIETLPVGALAPSADPEIYWASDLEKNLLWKIAIDGSAEATAIALPAGFDHVAASLEPTALLLGQSKTGELRLLSVANGNVSSAYVIAPFSALACDPSSAQLYSAGTHLDRLDLRTGQTTRIAQLGEKIRSLAVDPRDQSLWALNEEGTELINLNPVNATERSRVSIASKKPDSAPADWTPKPSHVAAFVFEPKSALLFAAEASILGGTRGMLWIDPKTGEVSDDGLRPNFNRELRPLNLRYARHLRNIKNNTNLTFYYTQVYAGDWTDTVYGADGSIGDDHSPPLSEDQIPLSEVVGIKQLMAKGTTHLTQVKAWDKWGLLKSAWAPIFGPDGRPVAMAGADINITTIRDAIRRSLVIAFLFGALQLTLAGAVCFAIARQLTRAIAAIKASALSVAAGDYAQSIRVDRPIELTALAVDFSGAAADLGRSEQELDASASAGRKIRESRALATRLASLAPLAVVAPDGSGWAWGAYDPAEAVPAGGAVIVGDRSLAWIAAPATDDPLAAVARRAQVAVTARALLQNHGADPVALAAALGAVLADETLAWILLTPTGAHVLSNRPDLVHLSRAPAPPLRAHEFYALPPLSPGEAIFLGSAPCSLGANAAATLSEWRLSPNPTARFVVIIQPAA